MKEVGRKTGKEPPEYRQLLGTGVIFPALSTAVSGLGIPCFGSCRLNEYRDRLNPPGGFGIRGSGTGSNGGHNDEQLHQENERAQ